MVDTDMCRRIRNPLGVIILSSVVVEEVVVGGQVVLYISGIYEPSLRDSFWISDVVEEEANQDVN